jgi:hypothetical protein
MAFKVTDERFSSLLDFPEQIIAHFAIDAEPGIALIEA